MRVSACMICVSVCKDVSHGSRMEARGPFPALVLAFLLCFFLPVFQIFARMSEFSLQHFHVYICVCVYVCVQVCVFILAHTHTIFFSSFFPFHILNYFPLSFHTFNFSQCLTRSLFFPAQHIRLAGSCASRTLPCVSHLTVECRDYRVR